MAKKEKVEIKKGNLDPNDQIKKLAQRMASLRRKKGYTNADFFAYDNDIHRSQYGRYENGRDLRFSTLVRIVNGYGLTLKEFFSKGFD